MKRYGAQVHAQKEDAHERFRGAGLGKEGRLGFDPGKGLFEEEDLPFARMNSRACSAISRKVQKTSVCETLP